MDTQLRQVDGQPQAGEAVGMEGRAVKARDIPNRLAPTSRVFAFWEKMCQALELRDVGLERNRVRHFVESAWHGQRVVSGQLSAVSYQLSANSVSFWMFVFHFYLVLPDRFRD